MTSLYSDYTDFFLFFNKLIQLMLFFSFAEFVGFVWDSETIGDIRQWPIGLLLLKLSDYLNIDFQTDE